MQYKDKVQKKCTVTVYDWDGAWPYKILGWGFRYYGETFRYRFDPVPGVKHWRNSFLSYYRRPRTTQERRWSFAHVGYTRPRRRYVSLPNDWDDCPYGRREKGWKRSIKKRQWMQKGDKLNEKTNWDLLLVD